MIQKLERDVAALTKIRHPNIVNVLGGVFRGVKQPLLIMELMENGSLYDILHNDTIVLEGSLLMAVIKDMVTVSGTRVFLCVVCVRVRALLQ